MRIIDSIIIHCSATKVGQDFSSADIDQWHRSRGFTGIGYHFIIRLDGKLEKGRDVSLSGAHCEGWNERSIGICYIGGLDELGRPSDTRTVVQTKVLYQIIVDLKREYNIKYVLGHRDTSPDSNKDGVIEPFEYIKACPCFDVKEFMRKGVCWIFPFLTAFAISLIMMGCISKKELIKDNMEIKHDSCMENKTEKRLLEQSVAFQNQTEVIEELTEERIVLFPVNSNLVNVVDQTKDSASVINLNQVMDLGTLCLKTTLKRRIESNKSEINSDKIERVENKQITEKKTSIQKKKSIYDKREYKGNNILWFLVFIIGAIIAIFVYFKIR